MEHDWSKFVLKINVNATVQAVYNAWTTPQKLEQWFLRKAIFHTAYDTTRERQSHIQAGDTYEWWWHGHDDDSVEKGKVMEANGTDKLQFSFTGGALVSVDIGTVLDETIIMLTQEKIPTDEHGKIHYHMGCMGGWTFYMANLKSYLEGGIDLRNKNLAFKGVVNS
jgi:uncharacterized protein YndB with AHSA1/START domain